MPFPPRLLSPTTHPGPCHLLTLASRTHTLFEMWLERQAGGQGAQCQPRALTVSNLLRVHCSNLRPIMPPPLGATSGAHPDLALHMPEFVSSPSYSLPLGPLIGINTHL